LCGVVAFLGTFVLGFVSKTLAERSKDRAAVAHALIAIRFGDRWIMPPAIGTMVLSGIMLAGRAGLPLLGTAWIFWSAILLGFSGAVFVLRVNPLQQRLEQSTGESVTEAFDWASYRPAARSWLIWAALAFAANLGAMALMVLKPDLPGP
jgi:uncharacterized membrane protein